MDRLLLVDGNSIVNRAFYGIMGNKMLMTADGTYTNAVYGFLAILFKIIDDLNPKYMAIAFDLKAPTHRHKIYEAYKGTRKGMPEELASQMPILKNLLKQMNITIIEKEGYEADDILGTLSRLGEKEGLHVTILSGDRDTFQLVTPNITVRIPRTKSGKTETEDFTPEKIEEVYGLKPIELIEVKGLMGDASDNIPGVPGVGEKTALGLVKKYKTIENLYNTIDKGEDDLKGVLKTKIVDNKELAILSKKLGTIDIDVPIDAEIEDFEIKPWNKQEVLETFKTLKFNRFIQRFNLNNEPIQNNIDEIFTTEKLDKTNEDKLWNKIETKKQIYYYITKREDEKLQKAVKKKIDKINIYDEDENIVYEIKDAVSEKLKEIFESNEITKNSYGVKEDYILLKQIGIDAKNILFDAKIASYLLNSSSNQYQIETLVNMYLNMDYESYLQKLGGAKQENQVQMSLFSENNSETTDKTGELNAYFVYRLKDVLLKKLEEINCLDLFNKIEMPLTKVLAAMQYEGIYIDKQELINYGNELQIKIEKLEKEIYELCDYEFNINSPKQLGEVLFEKLKLPVYKKNKSGYATDVDTLEKIKKDHPVIEKILEYRQVSKIKSTFVDGMITYINPNDNRVHSNFHQTVTATGRISSTEPNIQNIPTRMEIGKPLRKVFKPKDGYVFIDADYSQIELRVLAHISKDETMRQAFFHDEDIHRQVASRVFDVPFEEVTKEQRTAAKAVNFGIVYGISSFGLSEQLSIGRKKAEQYINQYMTKYEGVKKFMDDIVEEAKEKGYVETLFHRRRYIPELSSNNYMVRQFGARAAMNTPIQGTAADIMKIAMIKVFQKLQEEKLDAKLILQIHDELLIECKIEEKEKVKTILQDCMENAIQLEVPLKVEVSEADNWYDVK